MQQIWYIIKIISTSFEHLHAHLQEYTLYDTAYGVKHSVGYKPTHSAQDHAPAPWNHSHNT